MKKREEAVLKNTPSSDDTPVENIENLNTTLVHPKVNRRVGKQAAMIGLAISMGATSLLVTRQSDEAHAAASVGGQKVTSIIPAASDTTVKFASIKPEIQTVFSARIPKNSIILEPTAISQLPGLEARLQVTESEMSDLVPVSTSWKSQSPAAQELSTETANLTGEPQLQVLENTDTSDENNAQLKAQQEFALNRLQEKSNRLRKSLAELRSEETKNLSKTDRGSTQPKGIANVEELSTVNNDNNKDLLSEFTQRPETNKSNSQGLTKPRQIPALSGHRNYEVKPGDTLAAIATRYNISISELVQANNLINPDDLKISQRLTIPASEIKSFRAIQVPTVLNSNSIYSSTAPQPAKSPVTIPSIYPSLPVASSQLPVYTNNESVSIPIPVIANQQQKVYTDTESTSINDEGLGGDIPIPTISEQTQQAQKSSEEGASTTDHQGLRGLHADIERLRERYRNQKTGNADTLVATEPEKAPIPVSQGQTNSLEAEIERLREKYRNQRSGNANTLVATEPEKAPTTIPQAQTNSLEADIERLRQQYRNQKSGNANTLVATEPEKAAIPIPVVTRGHTAPSSPTTGGQNSSIPISVPSYGIQSANSQNRTRGNQAINPEFSGTFTSSDQKSTTFPTGTDISDSLGNRRGTIVTPQLQPQLPPLAAVDQYLPQPIDATTPPLSTTSTTYMWPARGVLTSGYGRRWGRMHRGIDIANATGTPIYAAADGVVETSGWNRGGFGILVDIRHSDGSLTRYAHNNRTLVRVGQQVTKGQQIAEMGSTGFSTGPHTHFEIHPSGKGAIDPIAFLPKERL
ncbi:peptidoglycan DD-metalloendopeptidase family protein [Anabaenopsis sp. FSS-46]|uniref:peptidoglycan DD-metalloendopeptidase family protein n=1 Tax=Anabaenopsis sp. FSS-46 TaxID=2971766 RepID=UPI002475A5E3|nr:peptidoglycan DD-metalloendopeptidase family protein [Anabaenopsis sp. FSS-46]MDH6099975.1 peptidoglycan DD-metalloendopeptidase family protein [Anabaenopsis sp. FSS-46]